MAEGILILKTTPGRIRPGGPLVAVGSYEALFVYRLLPAIEDAGDLQVAPTPLAGLVQTIGQTMIDRYLDEAETAAFDSGDSAWEFVTGERATVRDVEKGPLRLETTSEMIVRLRADWAAGKAAAVARWTETYRYTGTRLAP